MGGAALAAISAVASLLGSRSAKKQAKKANAEQAKRDAIMNLISVAGGGGTTGFQRAQTVPQVDYGGALASASNIASSVGQQKAADEQQTYTRERQKKLDAAANKAATSLENFRKEKLKIDAQRAKNAGSSGSGSSQGSDPFGQYRVY